MEEWRKCLVVGRVMGMNVKERLHEGIAVRTVLYVTEMWRVWE